MRVLILLRGANGCGKSTWVRNNNLQKYTISINDIRIMCQSPISMADGSDIISHMNERCVWDVVFNILKNRMSRGDFTVIDDVGYCNNMVKYKELAYNYGYKIFCVDFTDIPIDEVKRRNLKRQSYKRALEENIDRFYENMKQETIPSEIRVISPTELHKVWLHPMDLSRYNKIHHIGDIHGCYDELKKYIDMIGGIKQSEFYIFTGDYIDRGPKNVEVLKYLLEIKDKDNVMLLEGNHEKSLKSWYKDKVARSKEFELVTKEQLEKSNITKYDALSICKKLRQCAYYRYNGKMFIVTHGGISKIKDNKTPDKSMTLIPTDQLIHGDGIFVDSKLIANSWMNNTRDYMYQIHAHRNFSKDPIWSKDRVFNLEGGVESGGSLRVLQVTKDGFYPIEINNRKDE